MRTEEWVYGEYVVSFLHLGWLVKMKDVSQEDLKALMSTEEYKQYLQEGVV